MGKCAGFGEFADICLREAGSTFSPFYCPACGQLKYENTMDQINGKAPRAYIDPEDITADIAITDDLPLMEEEEVEVEVIDIE
jgi:hypothetical protein